MTVMASVRRSLALTYVLIEAEELLWDARSLCVALCRSICDSKVSQTEVSRAFSGVPVSAGCRQFFGTACDKGDLFVHQFKLFSATCKPVVGVLSILRHLTKDVGLLPILLCPNGDLFLGLLQGIDGKALEHMGIGEVERLQSCDMSKQSNGLLHYLAPRSTRDSVSKGVKVTSDNSLVIAASPRVNSILRAGGFVNFAKFRESESNVDLSDVEWEATGLPPPRVSFSYPYKVTPMEIPPSRCIEMDFWRVSRPITPPTVFRGRVVTGFQRGSAELGIPTANLDNTTPVEGSALPLPGVYYGWAAVKVEEVPVTSRMVMSVGYNPYYDNEKLTIEPYMFYSFDEPFLGATISLVVVGLLRAEAPFRDFSHLVQAIQNDCDTVREKDYEDSNSTKPMLTVPRDVELKLLEHLAMVS